ncbi:MAG: DUF4911 domain-containing protein [Desulfobacteraceae bacterium]|nr:DUF4911 domain-containing protein [Desulfobacteraceae bacterium]
MVQNSYTTKLKLRIDRKKIAFVKFIFEAYDGIAVLTTLDAQKGVIELSIAPGCQSIVEDVLMDIGRNIIMEPVTGNEDIRGCRR